ncbi:MAG: response regulator transcription factor [Dehalococcoidia bacterium]|nr:response regulator transcription factor [Dehalococcoidia bacterium]
MRLVIIDRDPVSLDVLSFVAQRRGHQSVGLPGVERLQERLPFTPEIAIVATTALDEGGLTAIRAVRERFEAIRVLVAAESPGPDGALQALRAGAQDVVKTPCSPFELFARIEAWAAPEAVQAAASSGGARLGDLEVDLEAYTATKNGRELALTKLERRLLYCLCQHHPNVATIDRLLAFGWDSLDEPDAGLLKTHISHIRKKLRDAGGVEFEIVSHQTVGYSMRLLESARTG